MDIADIGSDFAARYNPFRAGFFLVAAPEDHAGSANTWGFECVAVAFEAMDDVEEVDELEDMEDIEDEELERWALFRGANMLLFLLELSSDIFVVIPTGLLFPHCDRLLICWRKLGGFATAVI